MTQDELKMVLDALKWCHGGEPCGTAEAIAVVEKALAQPEQEPVAWPCLIAEADFSQDTVTLKMQCNDYKVSADKHWLYTTPPQRTWVGLTDDEISKISQRLGIDHDDSWTDLKQAIEAKLKERNT